MRIDSYEVQGDRVVAVYVSDERRNMKLFRYEQARPRGEWIECEEMNCHSDIEKIYICPFCKMKHHRKYDFCNCGADMRREEGGAK